MNRRNTIKAAFAGLAAALVPWRSSTASVYRTLEPYDHPLPCDVICETFRVHVPQAESALDVFELFPPVRTVTETGHRCVGVCVRPLECGDYRVHLLWKRGT